MKSKIPIVLPIIFDITTHAFKCLLSMQFSFISQCQWCKCRNLNLLRFMNQISSYISTMLTMTIATQNIYFIQILTRIYPSDIKLPVMTLTIHFHAYFCGKPPTLQLFLTVPSMSPKLEVSHHGKTKMMN
jgi:hypothetical protein